MRLEIQILGIHSHIEGGRVCNSVGCMSGGLALEYNSEVEEAVLASSCLWYHFLRQNQYCEVGFASSIPGGNH